MIIKNNTVARRTRETIRIAVITGHNIIDSIIDNMYVPIAWKGGRIIDVYKGKGDAAVCNKSRGLLIMDHMAKPLSNL